MLNIVFVGDSDSGKTSLIKRFLTNEFVEDLSPSKGISISDHLLELNNDSIKLHIIDIAGKQDLDVSAHGYIRTADAIVINYDASNDSFVESVEAWYNAVRDIAPSSTKYVISSNKNDTISNSENDINGRSLANMLNTDYISTSAAKSKNVVELFYKIYLAWKAEQEEIKRQYEINRLLQAQTSYTDYNKFLMFGDSITEYAFNQTPVSSEKIEFCLGAALQNVYVRKLQVIQRGFSGYNSRDAVPLIRSILKTEHDNVPDSQKIKIGYVFFGSNDSRKKGISSKNKEHVPLEDFIRNIEIVVSEFKKRNIPVILITPGLHDSALWNVVDPQDLVTGDYRDNETQKLYQDAMKENFSDVPMICLFDIMSDWMKSKATNPHDLSELLYDGIHLNGTGYKLLFDELMKTIEKHYYDVSPGCLMYRFPYSTTLQPDTFANIR